MTVLEQVKLLLGIVDTSKDGVLSLLITICSDEAVVYCHLSEYSNVLNSIVTRMVIEKYNRLGTEGVSAQSFSGVNESFNDGYSTDIVAALNKHRKLVLL